MPACGKIPKTKAGKTTKQKKKGKKKQKPPQGPRL